MKYNTKNRQLVINCLENNKDRHLTIEEIFSLLNEEVPLASLYRIIDDLVEVGIIRKYIVGPKEPCCYQFIDNNDEHLHFHLLCTECGKLIHLECDEVKHLLKHIELDHDFLVDISRVNLYGVCKDCRNRKG